MIYAIVTLAGLVIYTQGPWPIGSMNQCLAGAESMLQQNPKIVMEKRVNAWCSKYDDRPKLGDKLYPSKQAKQMMRAIMEN